MGRKNFLADIITASEKGIPNVMSISRGDDDGDVNFCFLHDSTEPIEVQILALGMWFYQTVGTLTRRMLHSISNTACERVIFDHTDSIRCF